MKRLALAVLAVLVLACPAPVQSQGLIEGLVFGGASLINQAIGRGQRKEYPAAQMLINVFVEDADGREVLQGVQAPSNGLLVGYGDRTVLELKPLVNASSPTRELKVLLNGIEYYKSAFAGGKAQGYKVGTKLGPKYGWPRLRLSDLDPGGNSITLVCNGTPYTTAICRLDHEALIEQSRDELVRKELSLAGQAMFPRLGVYPFEGSSGETRFLRSPEEAQALIDEQNREKQRQFAEQAERVRKDNEAKLEAATPKDSPEQAMLVWAGHYNPDQIAQLSVGEREKKLIETVTTGRNPLTPDRLARPIGFREGMGLAVVIVDQRSFQAMLVDEDGTVAATFSSRPPVGKYHSRLVMLRCGNDQPKRRLVIQSTDGGQATVLTFGLDPKGNNR